MNIHLINPYGTLPNEGWRKYRTNIAAEQLAAAGNDVILWISNIDHRSKKKRTEKYTEYEINPNYHIHIVPSSDYNDNASIGRIIYEKRFAKEVRRIFFEKKICSDCIIVTDPCVFYGDIIYKIARRTKSKFIIDILDIWPEVFVTVFPKHLRKIVNFLIAPLYYIRKSLYKKADGLIAVTNDYLQNALDNNSNKPSEVVFIGIDINDLKRTNNHLKSFHSIDKMDKDKWIIYAGTLGINYDIKAIMDFAMEIEKGDNSFKLMIAGDGPMKDHVIELISTYRLKKTHFLGRLNSNDLNVLYALCDIALSTYLETSTVSLPVKAFDYMAFGLPVVNSLGREYGELVKSKEIGIQYYSENSSDLFAKINQLLMNDYLLIQMKENCLNLANEFSIVRQYAKYVNFVNAVCQIEK